MGTKPFKAGELISNSNFVGESLGQFQTISKLLDDEQYEQAAQLLKSIPLPEQGENPFLAHILTAARQICHVCKQVQEEATYHQDAYHEAQQRKRELQQQLRLILDLIDQQAASGEPIDFEVNEETEERGNGRSWWQRLLDRFDFKQAAAGNKATVEEETAVFPEYKPDKIADNSDPTLTIYCLGNFHTYINDQSIDQWQGIKSKSLFKYLAINRQQPTPIEILMDTFWQENDPDSARRNLYQAIYLLRQTVQPLLPDFPFILSENGSYGLNPRLNIWLDSETFEAFVDNGRQLQNAGNITEAITTYETADNLYKGNFLAEDLYEDWPLSQRENLKQKYLNILQQLSQYHYTHKNWALCCTYYQRLLAIDNCREEAHRGLMRVYYLQGQRHLALRQYYTCVESLQNELEVDPMPETVSLLQQIQKNRFHFSPSAKLKPY